MTSKYHIKIGNLFVSEYLYFGHSISLSKEERIYNQKDMIEISKFLTQHEIKHHIYQLSYSLTEIGRIEVS